MLLWSLVSLFGCSEEMEETPVEEFAEISTLRDDSAAEENVEETETPAQEIEETSPSSTEDSTSPSLCADGIISPYAAELMIEITTVGQDEDIYSTYDRIEAVADLFEVCSDPWGLFPTTYKYITARGIQGIEEGSFEDPAWAERIIVDFAGRYLANLQAALLGEEPSWAWYRYYELADRSDVSKTRAVLMAMSAHLLLDLPHSLAHIETTEENKADFFMFGDLMIEVTDDFIRDLDEVYDTDAEDILNGFFLGQWVDGAFGADTTITLSYQAVRAKSWNNRWYLQQGWTWMADADISASFWSIDAVLRTMDGAGIID